MRLVIIVYSVCIHAYARLGVINYRPKFISLLLFLQDEVTYSSVVHVKTASKPAHIQTDITEHSEYASIK